MQFHLLSFEGPDPYARAGEVSSRMQGLAQALVEAGQETHLWFVGAPELPGHERRGEHLHWHRWCQWISRHHPAGVYSGEDAKERDFAASLPPYLLAKYLRPRLAREERTAVLAEEWQTANAVLHLDWLLRRASLRERTAIFWNANNTFGLERIDAARLARAATVTTVSRYMRRRMQFLAVDPIVIPNGLGAEAYTPVPARQLRKLAAQVAGRVLLVKVARWDPNQRWLQALGIAAEMKRQSLRPLLVAWGGPESHGLDVLSHARALGLRIGERAAVQPNAAALFEVVSAAEALDLLVLTSRPDPGALRLLFRGAAAVLANSGHEPFGLVGLEAMAAGALTCTGGTGEDYATPGRNALVVQTEDPAEFLGLFAPVWNDLELDAQIRRSARRTSRQYAWPSIVARNLLPRLDWGHAGASALHGAPLTLRSRETPVGRTGRAADARAQRRFHGRAAQTPLPQS